MKWWRTFRLWIVENQLRHRAVELQTVQFADIVEEARRSRSRILHDLADEVLKLDAVTDTLEETLQEMEHDD